MKARQLIILGSAAGIILIGVFLSSLLAGMKEEPEKKKVERVYRLVKVKEVKTDTLLKRIPINGKLVAAEKIEVFTEVTGKLLKSSKSFKVGQHFDKGEVLLAMDGTESLLNLKSQRSGFLNSIAQSLPDIKIDFESEYDTWKSFLDAITPEKALPALPEVNNPKLKNWLSGRNIYKDYYAIKSAENRQGKFTLSAPYDGSVSSGNVNPGTLIRANQKVGEFIADGAFELEAAIPDEDATGVTSGAKVMLSNGVTGKVIRVARNADPSTQRVSIYASVSGAGLKEGIYMEGVVEVAEIPNTISIDRSLVSDDGMVYLVNDSVLFQKPVKVVHSFEENLLITGLSPGDVLLNQVIQGAYEGMLVKTESN